MRESKTCLEELLHRTIDMIAYPNGAFSDEVLRLRSGRRLPNRLYDPPPSDRRRRRLLRLSRIDFSWYGEGVPDYFDPDAFEWQTR